MQVSLGHYSGSKARCSGCNRPAPGYDQLAPRRFEFIPIWGFAVVLLYAMRRVRCRSSGVKVEQVPWVLGKHTLCEAYMLFLAHWAKQLSWKETAQAFQTSWEKVFHAVEYVAQWGLQVRSLDSVRAIGVDEIQYGRAHQYLTLVDEIGSDCQRLLWVGKERTTQSFARFFALIGKELAQKDRVRLLRHVEALSGPREGALHQCAQHPRSIPRRGEDGSRSR